MLVLKRFSYYLKKMLQVFNTTKEKEAVRAKIVKTVSGEYNPSGITPPTHDVVRRRFELTRKSGENHLPYKVRQICEEISRGVEGLVNGSHEAARGTAAGRSQQQKDGDDAVSEVVLETVCEEVVDFQEWMADPQRPGHGVVVNLVGSDWAGEDALFLQKHPEILMSEVDAEEDAIEQLAAQQLRSESDRAAPPSAALPVETAEITKPSLDSRVAIAEDLSISESLAAVEVPSLKISLKLSGEGADQAPGIGSPAHSSSEEEDAMEEVEEGGEAEEEQEEEEDSDDEEAFAALLSEQRGHNNNTSQVAAGEEALALSESAEMEVDQTSEQDEDDDDDWMNNV